MNSTAVSTAAAMRPSAVPCEPASRYPARDFYAAAATNHSTSPSPPPLYVAPVEEGPTELARMSPNFEEACPLLRGQESRRRARDSTGRPIRASAAYAISGRVRARGARSEFPIGESEQAMPNLGAVESSALDVRAGACSRRHLREIQSVRAAVITIVQRVPAVPAAISMVFREVVEFCGCDGIPSEEEDDVEKEDVDQLICGREGKRGSVGVADVDSDDM